MFNFFGGDIILEEIASNIAEESGKDKEIILYGLTILINTVFGYLLLILTAYFFGWTSIALAAAISASAFRIFTGGLHAKTNVRCVVNGALIFNLIAFISLIMARLISLSNLKFAILLFGIIAFVTILFLAPVDVPEKPIDSKLQKKILKSLALILCLVWTFLAFNNAGYFSKEVIIASIFGLLWQMLTLTNFLKVLKLI